MNCKFYRQAERVFYQIHTAVSKIFELFVKKIFQKISIGLLSITVGGSDDQRKSTLLTVQQIVFLCDNRKIFVYLKDFYAVLC